MKNSDLFWQDIEFAISTLMLRDTIHQIIIESRKTGQSLWEINRATLSNSGRDHILFHYHEVMMTRFRNHHGHNYA